MLTAEAEAHTSEGLTKGNVDPNRVQNANLQLQKAITKQGRTKTLLMK